MTLFKIGMAGRPIAAGLVLLLPPLSLGEERPLTVRIDEAVAKGNVAPVAGGAGDAEFVRRIHLDLTGRIPTAEEVRAYLQDGDAQKRARLVDRLLAGREFARHLAITVDLWLMERRADTHVPNAQWRKYLTDSFAANKPFDQLAREILGADGTEEKSRPAARFYLDRIGEPHLITRDVGRLFFGKDLQCAQCHDHPNVADYLQREYYGLFAFYTRTSFFQPDTKKPALLSEKAAGEGNFQSVFTDVKGTARPRLPGGEEFEEPAFKAGEEYKVAPNPKDKKVRAVPKYSRREQLAKLATDGTSRAFNRNVANRLWGHMMGRPLVEPNDLSHAGNPPAHPELLDLLADEIVALKFDVRAFLRALALTDTYARSFELPTALAGQAQAVAPKLAELEAEAHRLGEAATAATSSYEGAKKSWEAAKKAFDGQAGKLAEARKKRDEAAAARKKAEEPVAKAREVLAASDAKLKPLAEAEAKTAEAVKALPDDKELAEAAAKFKQRSEELRAGIAKQQGELAAIQKAVDEAGTKLAAAAAAAEELAKLVSGEEAKLAALDAELEKARSRYRAEKSGAGHAQRRFEDARDLVAYAETRRDAQASRENAGKLGTELTGFENDAAARQKLTDDLDEAARRSESAKVGLPDDAELAKAVEVLRDRGAGARQLSEAANRQLAERKAQAEAAKAKSNELQQELDGALDSLTQRWTSAFAVGVFAPLTPEQLCASTLQATGEWERTVATVTAEFEKKLAEAAKKEAEPAKKEGEKKEGEKKDEKKPPPPKLTEADRGRWIEEQIDARLKASFDKFVALFGGQAGQPQSDFYATADQALFFENDGLVRGWLRPNGENLTARLTKIDDPAQLAEELYLRTVTRAPSDAEKAKVRDYLAAPEQEKAIAIQELAWALISSVEFRFKH